MPYVVDDPPPNVDPDAECVGSYSTGRLRQIAQNPSINCFGGQPHESLEWTRGSVAEHISARTRCPVVCRQSLRRAVAPAVCSQKGW